MFRLVLLSALLAVATAAPGHLAPVLLPKVNIAPTQLTVVKEPHVVSQPEPVYRDVPIPYKTVQYTAPHVVQPAPVVVKEPVSVHPVIQAAPVAYSVASPVVHAASVPVPNFAPVPYSTYSSHAGYANFLPSYVPAYH